MMEFEETTNLTGARLKVIGVGGAGGNAINTMIEEGLEGVDFIAANTDIQALSTNKAPTHIQLGVNVTRGLGAGSNPEVGKKAAMEAQSEIQEALQGADMVFVAAGMGGGTGTGAAPVVAAVARDLGILTVGVVTKPFKFEGKRRERQAEAGLAELKKCVDTLITIPNNRLQALSGEAVTLLDAFRQVDYVLLHAVQSISEIIIKHGGINTDFADVKAVMSNRGMALMGTGTGTGPNRAEDAAEAAISSPLLDDVSIHGATAVLINITSPSDVSLQEVISAVSCIEEAASDDVHIIWGQAFDDELGDAVKVTVIATGFEDEFQNQDQQFQVQNYLQNPMNNSVPRQQTSGMFVPVAQPNPYTASGSFVPAAASASGHFNENAMARQGFNPVGSPFGTPAESAAVVQNLVDSLGSEAKSYVPNLNKSPAGSYIPKTSVQPVVEETSAAVQDAEDSLHQLIASDKKSSSNDLPRISTPQRYAVSRPKTPAELTAEQQEDFNKPAYIRLGGNKNHFMDNN